MNAPPDFSDEITLAARNSRWQAIKTYSYSHRWFMLFVILPVALSTFYFTFVASDQFVSESRFVVRSTEHSGGQVSSIANLIQTTGLSRGQEETNAVLDYIRSRDALNDLTKKLNVRAIFSRPDVDPLSRFPFLSLSSPKNENLYNYYSGKVDAHLDGDTGLAVLKIRAFDPSDAHKLNEDLLELSERLVNRLNERALRHGIGESEKRVRNAESRVRAARAALMQYRNSQNLIDPDKQAGGIFDVVTQLMAQRATLRAQLDQMVKVAPSNPAIPSLRARVAAMSREVDSVSSRIVGNKSAIASKMGQYESLVLEQTFAEQALTAASASLEQARNAAEKQQFYLERVVEPSQPDLALFPKRFRYILTIAATALALYFVGWMLIVGILEHAPED